MSIKNILKVNHLKSLKEYLEINGYKKVDNILGFEVLKMKNEYQTIIIIKSSKYLYSEYLTIYNRDYFMIKKFYEEIFNEEV